MKEKAIISIVFFLIGLCVGGIAECASMSKRIKNNEQVIIDNGRTAMIEFNKEYNKVYNNLGYLAIGQGNEYAIVTMQVLQKLTSELIKLNKSLKLDCKIYRNGAPSLIEDENGNTNPLEKLPEEIRILK